MIDKGYNNNQSRSSYSVSESFFDDYLEGSWKSGKFRLENIGLDIILHPNVRMRYKQDDLVSKDDFWKDDRLKKTLGLTEFNFIDGIWYITISVRDENLLSKFYKYKDYSILEKIKDFALGHEEIEAANISGNSESVFNLLRLYGVGKFIDKYANLARRYDKMQKESFDSKTGKRYLLSDNLRERLANGGGLIALNRKKTSKEMKKMILGIIK